MNPGCGIPFKHTSSEPATALAWSSCSVVLCLDSPTVPGLSDGTHNYHRTHFPTRVSLWRGLRPPQTDLDQTPLLSTN